MPDIVDKLIQHIKQYHEEASDFYDPNTHVCESSQDFCEVAIALVKEAEELDA